MKRRNRPQPSPQYALIEKKTQSGRSVEFPAMKGRTVEKIAMYTTTGYHSISVAFADKTVLTLALDPGFVVRANFDDPATGDTRSIQRWPAIASIVDA